MRIVLLYPPPWKIPSPGEKADQSGQGPPSDDPFIDSNDEKATPYGLISLAAQAKRNGHDVVLLNLYTFSWRDITGLLSHLPADLYGLSCFTGNRRGTLYLAKFIKEIRPQAYVVIGGPHASALPREMMEHCKEIDGLVIGEGEATFNELVERLENNKPAIDIPGMAWRTSHEVHIGPPRERIDNPDSLASPFDYYKGHILITSRGCPGNCTFCGSRAMWGRKLRFHSARYVVDVIENIVNNHNEKSIAFKDDTFTCNRKRVLQICREIIDRDIRFQWSCDTRVDTLDEEILFAMRRAGCEIISFGVESGSQPILNNINKRITPEQILKATKIAKKFGFQIRYYLMAGNRGESEDTLQASLDLIADAKPNNFLFSFLSIFPGTTEFEIAEKAGLANREMFFAKENRAFKYFFREKDTPKLRQIVEWIKEHVGTSSFSEYSISEREKILKIFPDLPAAHMDLGGAYYKAGNFLSAQEHIQTAIDMGYPLPGFGYNYLACIVANQGDMTQSLNFLEKAKKLGAYYIVDKNLESLRSWVLSGGMQNGDKPELTADHIFAKGRLSQQPIMPGPINLLGPAGSLNTKPAFIVPAL